MGRMKVIGYEGTVVMICNRKKKTFTVEIPRNNTVELFFDDLGVGLEAKRISDQNGIAQRKGVVILIPKNIKKVKLVIKCIIM